MAPRNLDGQVEELGPQLVVSNETTQEARAEVSCWVEILFNNNLDANVYTGGRSYSVEDIGIADFLAIIDEYSP